MTTKLSATTDPPDDAHALRRAALTAVPGYPEIINALSIVDERLGELHTTPEARSVDVTSVSARLLQGEELPPPGELGAQVAAYEARVLARVHESKLLAAVRVGLEQRRDAAIRTDGDRAFEWLERHLHGLVDRAREVLSRLGPVRSAEEALDSDNPGAARDDLRALRDLADEHQALRGAQRHLVRIVAEVTPGTRPMTQNEQRDLVQRHGLVDNPTAAGTPPADHVAQLVWMIESKATPEVPRFAELLRRGEAARLTSPTPAGNIVDSVSHAL